MRRKQKWKQPGVEGRKQKPAVLLVMLLMLVALLAMGTAFSSADYNTGQTHDEVSLFSSTSQADQIAKIPVTLPYLAISNNGIEKSEMTSETTFTATVLAMSGKQGVEIKVPSPGIVSETSNGKYQSLLPTIPTRRQALVKSSKKIKNTGETIIAIKNTAKVEADQLKVI